MSITPFISEIREQGGTFYTFPSASEDFTFSITKQKKTFTFSKFVLLDLPDIKDQSTGINGLGVDKLPSAFLRYDGADWNKTFIESFQNYCLNLESLMVQDKDYNENTPRTVSERVFFKWLKEIGAIRFREANVGNPEDGGERTRKTGTNETGKRFVEEDLSDTYNSVVKYIGNIDIVNTVKYKGTSFLEIYTHVPNDVGSTPKVLFKSLVDDDFYKYGKVFTNNAENPLDNEYLTGRSYNDEHPSGLDTHAYFDSDTATYQNGSTGVNEYNMFIKKSGSDTFEEGWWFTSPQANSYFTEPTKLNDYRNDILKIEGYKESVATEQIYTRSRLDGIVIDFDLANSYSDNLSGQYKTFEDYNRSENASNFSFNTVLIYYDLTDDANPLENTTNLFGVLFLNNVTDTVTNGGQLERFKKYKPNSVSRQNGNSYSFKPNLKLDLNAQDTQIFDSVNEYNNFSMHLFLDALKSLQKAGDVILSNSSEIQLIKQKVEDVEDLVLTSENLETINQRLDDIDNTIESASFLLGNSKEIVSLIDRNYQEILNIYKNYTSVDMAYNLDVIASGYGIELDKSINGKVKVLNKSAGYGINDKYFIDVADLSSSDGTSYYTIHELKEFPNYVKYFTDKTEVGKQTDFKNNYISLYVDDSKVSWKNGQSFKIVFSDKFIFSQSIEKAFVVYTDSKNYIKSKDGKYSLEICKLSPQDFGERNGKVIVEIICMNWEKSIFTFDILN